MTNIEQLGPAERIIQTVLGFVDHAYHGRPGYIRPAPNTIGGVQWFPVTSKTENGETTVLSLTKVGRKSVQTPIGKIGPDKKSILATNGQKVGEYREAGIYSEVASWMYEQISEVWKLDNEFAAHWASYTFGQEHKDLKVALTAFMLVQSRKGDPVLDGGKVVFHDEDYRDIGEAMVLLQTKDQKDLNPKLLLRVHDFLTLPKIAEINRKLGFGNSARKPFLGRWPKAVIKWLEYRDQNRKLLENLVKAGFRTTVMQLAQIVGFKPETPRFFKILRWTQKQSKDGRRQMAIGEAVKAAESWEGLTEEQICKRILKTRPNFKRIVGLLPKNPGLTRAVMAAAIEAQVLSDKDIIILTPTLEEKGLLEVPEIKLRWEKAAKGAEDMRAANIATRVKSKETQEKLVQAADTALQKAVEEVSKNLRVYFLVDRSGSMSQAITKAKVHLAKFLQAFSLDRLHVSSFNTVGQEITIRHASAAGVENAFKGVNAGGGTDYASGVYSVGNHKPKDDEDAIFIFYGDEQNGFGRTFEAAFNVIGFKPVAFGLVRVIGTDGDNQRAVQDTATKMGIPCFLISENTFEDPYAIPRTIRNLIAATPVGQVTRMAATPRVTLTDIILKTPLLQKPSYAC